MRTPLTKENRAEAMPALEAAGWTLVDGRDAIARTFEFRNFVAAFQWMTGVAIWAERLDHHPEWSNVYRTVDVILTTHDAQGLTELDLKLAQKMDALFDQQG